METALDNPLIAPIARILTATPQVNWTEHALISSLVEQGFLSADYGRESLALFQTHFLVMNALYQLCETFHQRQLGRLTISPLSIVFAPAEGHLNSVTDDSRELVAENGQLAAYYLSWETFSSATGESVDQLLDSFWRRYVVPSERFDALALMELQEPVTLVQIKQRYREKAMVWHPDRGGSNDKLAELNDALDVLKRHYS